MAEYRVIGKALRKVDAVAKVTGEYFYKCHSIAPTKAAQDDEAATRLWQYSESTAG